MTEFINWCILENGNDQYRLHGEIYGDSRFQDGQIINTSRICGIRRKGTVLEIQTKNTLYCCKLESHLLWALFLGSDVLRNLKACLEYTGFGHKETEFLIQRMRDAYGFLDEKKREKLQKLLTKKTESGTILEFSTEENYYYRFLANRKDSEIRFWDESSLTVFVGAEENRSCLINAGDIQCRFTAFSGNRLRITGCTDNMGEIYVRNGGFSPLTVELESCTLHMEPGACRKLQVRPEFLAAASGLFRTTS